MEKQQMPVPEAFGRNLDILMIEDNPGDALLIREMLTDSLDSGFSLTIAQDLKTGLRQLGETSVDLILLDLNLPDSNGTDTYARIRNRFPEAPVVALTGISDETTALALLRQGIQDYLEKGRITGRDLKRSIRYSIERKHSELLQAKLIQDLQSAHDMLEQKVWERTRDLSDTNERLYREVRERELACRDLEKALEDIKTLKGLLPICSQCKKIRDDQGYWNHLESFIEKNSDASFSHGICPACSDDLYGHEDWYIDMKKKQGR